MLSVEHCVITGIGYGTTASNILNIQWKDIELGTEIISQNFRVAFCKGKGRGTSGGSPSTPFLRVLQNNHTNVQHFLETTATAAAASTAAPSTAEGSTASPPTAAA